jgi:thiosulfate/3-mercaptopyruvate sulfurtransferase
MHTTLVSTATLAQHVGDAGWRIVDVRHDLSQPDRWGEDRFREGHVPGAVFAHIDRDLSAPKNGRNGRHPLPTPEAAANVFARLGIGTDVQVVAYDQGSGMFAARLWWMLHWLGHDAVAVLDGGFEKWQREGRPVSRESAIPARARFAIRRVGPTVDARRILDSLG